MTSELETYLASAAAVPYKPGTHDCATFVARWVDLLTGSALAPMLASAYHTKFQGIAKLAPMGICTAVQSVLTSAGWKRVSEPRDGDVCLTDLDHPGIWHAGAIRCQPFGARGALILQRQHLRAVLTYHQPAPCQP